ncbi:SID1 transmembrane family member 2-like isoform X2 [Lethenteron reissneri]|uniref:SID1 transmembrane family member 2-like isoform X2 n=1 Tax=Lethenteron reissneri TaxID=7753 RepID=UPI002AB702E0|nr:SID1 transmembrane family member 2-like isoform X2 [Lethenteron reissneri]
MPVVIPLNEAMEQMILLTMEMLVVTIHMLTVTMEMLIVMMRMLTVLMVLMMRLLLAVATAPVAVVVEARGMARRAGPLLIGVVWLIGPGLANVQTAEFNKVYNGSVMNGTSAVYDYSYVLNKTAAVRVWVQSSWNDSTAPLLFVVQQQQGVMSWQLPIVLRGTTGIPFLYLEAGRTLCTPELAVEPGRRPPAAPERRFTVTVGSQASHVISFQLKAHHLYPFILKAGEMKSLNATPSQPQYLLYEFRDGEDSVVVEVQARGLRRNSTLPCSVLSVQDVGCPVNDLDQNVDFSGVYQTMTSRAAITVQKKDCRSGQFFVVFVVKADDVTCGGPTPLTPIKPGGGVVVDSQAHIKMFNVTVKGTASPHAYINAVVFGCSLFLPFYLIAFIALGLQQWRSRLYGDMTLVETASPEEQNGAANVEVGVAGGRRSGRAKAAGPAATRLESSSSEEEGEDLSEDEDQDYDTLEDVLSDKNVIRSKACLYVSDLSRKRATVIGRKYRIYCWNLLTVGVFYVLPVIQLVLTYQNVLHTTGDQDICYYNFLCARPLGMLSSFNNVFSNLGYFLLGLLFLLIVGFREFSHQLAVRKDPAHLQDHGLPKHFGLFYSMGFALMMEGVLSACYHVCPNYSNFQFDTAFMYIIAGLCMLKLYQKRHSDVNASAYKAYASFAVVIFFAVLGVVVAKSAVWFWILCTIVHILAALALSFHIYHVGRWRFSLGIFRTIAHVFYTDCIRQCNRPMHMDRLILLLLGNAFNWSYAIWGMVYRPRDFDSYLLAIFMCNLLLYSAFYIIMKIRSGESIRPTPLLCILAASVAWGFAMYFFFQGLTSWEETAAQSRERNKECVLLKFYDHHDIWHFLSSIAMFLSFMVLLTLDDDLDSTRRDRILVF